MAPHIYYIINSDNVISEIIDGEAMIINLDNGFYFSMEQVGTLIWEAIEQGCSFDQIAAGVKRRYIGDPQTIEIGVRQLIDQLLAEGLITSVNQPPAETDHAQVVLSQNEVSDKMEYIEPSLNKYTDMEDLLLLDPVHQVDDTGWPDKKPGAE
jgi:hypothetical protein